MSEPHYVCTYCEHPVADERTPCCDEVHNWECGDEGRLCSECFAVEEKKWAAHFGLTPGMNRQERANQLERMNPHPATDEQMDARRKLK